MEIKKSYRADIEHKRTTNFLLGLVLVLAMLYVGFEYTSGPADDSHNNDMTDDVSQDIELMPAMDVRDMIAVAPSGATHAVTENSKPWTRRPKWLRNSVLTMVI